MKQVVTLFLTFVIVIAGSSSAIAHRPYFTQVEKIRLPDGDTGEARLLNGDGILGPDPVRVLILNHQGHLLARSPKSFAIRLSCRDGGECLIFDLTHDKVLELEASSFRQGNRVPGLSINDRDNLWELEDGDEAWGFHARDLAPSERLAGLRALVVEYLPMVIINGAAGGFCWLIATGVWLVIKTERTRVAQTLVAIAVILILATVGLLAVFMSFLLSAISALPFAVWVLSLAIGGALAIMGSCAVKYIKNASASAEGSIP
ncbi:hypothetical protein [Microvirga sp. G4-2]|uniref:hypothetical protein n=1 Tax=Microvirga sp. G4-2 TaxID=3434467 RepID=UPI004045095B